MPIEFTKPEQKELLEIPYITYVSSKVVKFDKSVIE